MPQGNHAGAGKGGKVDHGRGLVIRPGVVQRVAEDQPPLGVGIGDLDGQAGHGGKHVARFVGPAVRHVLGGGDDADQVDRQPQPGCRLQRPQYRRRTGHVGLHLLHAGPGLDGDAAGVEGNPLADQHLRPFFALAAAVFQHDEARRLGRTLADRHQGVHPQLFQLVPLQHPAGQAMALRQLVGRLSQIAGGGDVAGMGDQIAGQTDATAERLGPFDPGAGFPGCNLFREQQGHGSESEALVPVFGLVLVEAVTAEQNPFADRLQRRVATAEQLQRRSKRGYPRAAQRLHGIPCRLAQPPVVQFAFLAETDQQQPLGRQFALGVDQMGGIDLAGEFPGWRPDAADSRSVRRHRR